MKTTIGGDRLGSGNKQEVSLRSYNRSTHDLSYVWRSSMSSGTLVPFMSELALPGDSWDIDLECDVKTLPTIGPLFGSYKVQLDVFECPVRLYNGKLHMNMLNIGMDMSEIHLPQMKVLANYDPAVLDDNSQVNPSSILSYLNVRGCGRTEDGAEGNITREFNAIPYLGYWEIFKNYYANKMETDAYVIHQADQSNEWKIAQVELVRDGVELGDIGPSGSQITTNTSTGEVSLIYAIVWENDSDPWGAVNYNDIKIDIDENYPILVNTIFDNAVWAETLIPNVYTLTFSGGYAGPAGNVEFDASTQTLIENTEPVGSGLPQLKSFRLTNIDEMREAILQATGSATAFEVDYTSDAPYGLALDTLNGGATGDYENAFCKANQEGLALKTYQSDLFNNWINTKWIDGVDSVSEVTAIDTSGGDFTIDTLNLSQKVYNMLNRIAVSGGSYDDWLDAVYTHERAKSIESPVYHGSLIKELGFEEVVSNADTQTTTETGLNTQPLGTLAGRGRLSGKNKGGKIKIKVNEPSYIMGIVSITPRIDYSQGNKWDMSLKTLNDLHKPALDEIGWQSLLTDQMSWFDTTVDNNDNMKVEYVEVGKQPAWINYMTNVNQCKGNFAIRDKEMFMTLNRRYEQNTSGIKDITTYIDPSKYNNIFAETAIDSQNFWVQIGNNIKARRKMSAKVIPNL